MSEYGSGWLRLSYAGQVGVWEWKKASARRSRMRQIVAVMALAGAFAMPAPANVVTVATNSGAGVDYTSIQAAIDALAGINPATDEDTNGYHTILIQAGTYSTNSGETFQTHTVFTLGRGKTGSPSRSLIAINDTDGDMGHSTNRYLDGLRLIGAGIGQTIIDAGTSAGNNSRVMCIGNRDVVIHGMTLEHGNTTAGGWAYTGGASILGLTNGAIRLEDIRIADSISGSTDGNLGPVVLRCTDGAIFQNVEITGCTATGNVDVFYVSAATANGRTFLNRLNVHGNQAGSAAVNVAARNNVVFNCAIMETGRCGGGGGGLAVNGINASSGVGTYVGNCTICDNAGYAINDNNYWGLNNYILNSIIADNGGATTNSGTGNTSRMYCMHNVLDQSDWAWGTPRIDGYTTSTGDDGTNDPIPDDPKFEDQAGADYRLLPNSPAIESIPTDGTESSAFVLTGGTAPNQFVYVDVNKNGVYDLQLDVIIKLKGYTPGTNDWVSTQDLAGWPRLRAQGLDAGCYEWQPPGGTVVMFK